MTWNQTKVEHGGLMRCCLYSLGQFVEEHGKEGTLNSILKQAGLKKKGKAK